MKALINTLVLAAILVVAVLYLRTMPEKEQESAEEVPQIVEDLDTPPTVVKSVPAVRTRVDTSMLEETNTAALFKTGVELFDLWRVEDATRVFEALVARNPNHVEARGRLIECYANPLMIREAKAREQLMVCRDMATKANGDTLWVAALNRLFVRPVPRLAIEHLNELVASDPQDIHVRLLLAQALLMADREDEARSQLEELLEGDSTLGRARELMVQCLVAQGILEDAETIARDLATLYTAEPYPYVLLATVLLTQGKIDEAEEFCNNALTLDGRYVPAIVARARLYAVRGQVEAARVSFEKLLLFDDPMLRSVGMEGIASVDFQSGRFGSAMERMDHAIRLAMSEGSARRGMIYVFRLVDYLCELGRVDAADIVLNRWVSGRGEIPLHLGRLRIAIGAGNTRQARAMLEQIEQDDRWQDWMYALGIDLVQYQALAFIGEKRYGRALHLLAAPGGEGVVGTRRDYLRGFALFQSGEAERASQALLRGRFRDHSSLFPYESDPVLRVQATFFLAEAALARGESRMARGYYNRFLRFWGEADWELQAVARARDKITALSPQSGG